MAVRIGQNHDIYWRAGIDTSDFKKGIVGLKDGFVQGAKASDVFKLSLAAIPVLLGAAGKAAYNFSNEFRDAMLEVKTITGQTEEQFNQMSDQVIKMSQDIPISATEMAKGLYQIVSAGFDGAEGIKVLEAASKAAIGGITDTATAADGLTTVLNSFGLKAKDAQKVADTMFTTVRLGKTTFGELASSLSNVSSLAAVNKISFDEISAAIATLTKNGVPTALAITQIRTAILSTNKVLGDGAFAAMSMQDAFQLVRDKAKGSDNALRDMLGRVEALNGVLGLTGANAQKAASDLTAIQNSVGAAEAAFNTMLESNQNQIDLLVNRIKAGSKDVGDALVNMVGAAAKGINEAIDEANPDKESILKGLGFSADDADIIQVEMATDKLKKNLDELRKKRKEIDEDFTSALPFFGTSVIDADNLRKKTVAVVSALRELKELEDKLLEEDFADDTAEGLGEVEKVTEKAKITLNSLKQELKDLQDQLGDADIKEAGKVQIEINAKLKEIENFEASAFKRKTEGALKPIKAKVNLVYEQKDKASSDGIEKKDPLPSEEKTKNFVGALRDASDVMFSLSNAAGAFDSELGEALNTMASLASSGAQLGLGITSGDPTQVIAGAAGILQTLGTLMQQSNDVMIQQARELNQLYSETNFILKEQNRLQEKGSLDATRAYKELEDQLGKTNGKIESFTLVAEKNRSTWDNIWGQTDDTYKTFVDNIEEARTILSGKNFQLDRLNLDSLWAIGEGDLRFTKEQISSLQELANRGFDVKNLDQLQALVDEYDKLQAEQRKLNDLLTATTAENIADGIAEGFLSGKKSLDDFAGDFEKLMQKAIIESFKQQFLLSTAQDFQDKFAKALASDGTITEDEIKDLRQGFGDLIKSGKEQFDVLNEVFKGATGVGLREAGQGGQDEPLTGTISASLSETTGNELVGLWTRSSADLAASRDIQSQSLAIQQEIAENTFRTAELLDQIVSNQSNERALGI